MLKKIWMDLKKPIYVGERLEQNLKALRNVSIITAILSLALMLININMTDPIMFVAAAATLVGAVLCWFFAAVPKNRELASLVPVIFCGFVLTIYALTGIGKGTACLWTLLMPIGISYFVSVCYGMILSGYFSVLFVILFYTPLKARIGQYYTDQFMSRFPLLFISLAAFTILAMIQYHRSTLVEIEYTDRLNEEVDRKTHLVVEQAKRLEEISDETVRTLAFAIDAKDRYTNGHSFRVAVYAVALAEKLGWTREEIHTLRWEGLLHDIGKIGVPDAVLNKPGRLTQEEFEIIKSHTTLGGSILESCRSLQGASDVARCHHERYDGRGYPSGLKGAEIPLHARIVAIADAYDAMHSDRIYRKGLSHEVIRSELEKGRGTQFDPELLPLFLELFESGALDEAVRKRKEEIGEVRLNILHAVSK